MRLIKFLKKNISIDSFKISYNSRCFIVAELSGNHNGKIQNVFKAIDLVKNSGANAIKIQSYEPDTITLNVRNKHFLIDDDSIWKGKYLYDLYAQAYTPFKWHKKIFAYAKKRKITCFSSPFDTTSVDLLEKLNCPCYKIASAEITDLKLIDYVAKKKKPIIISTGVANDKDIQLAINQCIKNNNNKIILLNCISSYPAKDSEVNIKHMDHLKKFTQLVGFSDHTKDDLASIISVAKGAKLIEKHFKISEKTISTDSKFSMSYIKFKELVQKIRRLEKLIGIKNPNKKKILRNKIKTVSRSLFYLKDLKKGDIINQDNIKSIRPGTGLNPQKYFKIIGKKLKKNVKKFTPVKSRDI
jgi:pseudaminic acid synthase